MSTESDAVTYERYHYTCIYCDFDGRGFDGWMQLTIEHVRPRSCGGSDEPDNRAAACGACNNMTSKMSFSAKQTTEEIFQEKLKQIVKSRNGYYSYWTTHVAPKFLNRPLRRLASFGTD